MTSPSSSQWPSSAEKHIREFHQPNGGGVRSRRPIEEKPKRKYRNAIGLFNDDDDSTIYSTTTNSNHLRDSESRRSQHKRREIRRRLRQKKKIPGHLKWTRWMGSEYKNHTVAVLGEFVGTTFFLFFAFGGTQVANIPAGDSGSTTGAATGFNIATLLYISLSFGFSLMVNAWIFFRISGGLFNPAVTLALTLTRDLPLLRAALLFFAQLSGACFASYLVSVIFPSPFNVQTTLAGNTSIAQGIFIEALSTSLLVFTIIMLAKEKHRATYIAPVGIGLALFIAELTAVYYTGGSLNPARSFGPAVVQRSFSSNHWIYWLGPAIGSLLAVGFFELMKVLEYEMANPGQDGDEENDPTENPELEVAQRHTERQEEVEVLEELGGEEAIGSETDGEDMERSEEWAAGQRKMRNSQDERMRGGSGNRSRSGSQGKISRIVSGGGGMERNTSSRDYAARDKRMSQPQSLNHSRSASQNERIPVSSREIAAQEQRGSVTHVRVPSSRFSIQIQEGQAGTQNISPSQQAHQRNTSRVFSDQGARSRDSSSHLQGVGERKLFSELGSEAQHEQRERQSSSREGAKYSSNSRNSLPRSRGRELGDAMENGTGVGSGEPYYDDVVQRVGEEGNSDMGLDVDLEAQRLGTGGIGGLAGDVSLQRMRRERRDRFGTYL